MSYPIIYLKFDKSILAFLQHDKNLNKCVFLKREVRMNKKCKVSAIGKSKMIIGVKLSILLTISYFLATD